MENLKQKIKKFFGESVSFGVSNIDMFVIELPFVDRNNDFTQVFIYKNKDKYDIVIVGDTKYDNHKFQFDNIEVEKEDIIEGWDTDNLIIRNSEEDKVCQNICNLLSEFLKAGG